MKSAVFARPNLKAFLLGALLIAVIQNFIANGNLLTSTVHARSASRPDKATGPSAEIQQLLAQAQASPTSHLYLRISRCYEKQGDVKKAIVYLRRAQLLAQFEEADD